MDSDSLIVIGDGLSHIDSRGGWLRRRQTLGVHGRESSYIRIQLVARGKWGPVKMKKKSFAILGIPL